LSQATPDNLSAHHDGVSGDKSLISFPRTQVVFEVAPTMNRSERRLPSGHFIQTGDGIGGDQTEIGFNRHWPSQFLTSHLLALSFSKRAVFTEEDTSQNNPPPPLPNKNYWFSDGILVAAGYSIGHGTTFSTRHSWRFLRIRNLFARKTLQNAQ